MPRTPPSADARQPRASGVEVQASAVRAWLLGPSGPTRRRPHPKRRGWSCRFTRKKYVVPCREEGLIRSSAMGPAIVVILVHSFAKSDATNLKLVERQMSWGDYNREVHAFRVDTRARLVAAGQQNNPGLEDLARDAPRREPGFTPAAKFASAGTPTPRSIGWTRGVLPPPLIEATTQPVTDAAVHHVLSECMVFHPVHCWIVAILSNNFLAASGVATSEMSDSRARFD